MNPEFLHECIILDANCVINLYASGEMPAILRAIPKSIAVATYVRNKEALHIYNRPVKDTSAPPDVIDLQPLIDERLIILASPDTEDEEIDAISLGLSVDTGEAITAAIAKARNWAIGLDDKDAIKFFSQNLSSLQLLPTLAFLCNWEMVAKPSPDAVSKALYNMRVRSRYKPKESHPYFAWWSSRMPVMTISSNPSTLSGHE